jgi:pimeloyl-ACP methyl ester carboxylesterase
MNNSTLTALPLPDGVRSRQIQTSTGLDMHVLEAGFEPHAPTHKPLVVLLHGFPELAFSWRHQLTALSQAGFHVIAPDQRGYGRTLGGDDAFDGNWRASNMLQLVDDVLALVNALGHTHVHALIGHDFGSPVAAWCALTRPDVFRSVVLMSAPFSGPPDAVTAAQTHSLLTQEVAALEQLPAPRQHYQWYYSNRQANEDMWHAPQGLHDFMRAYYHVKSADWAPNQPFRLKAWQASELAHLPHYYVMPLGKTMAQAVAEFMPDASHIHACQWLPDSDLAVYSAEYARRGYQGGLQWYRCGTDRDEFIALSQFSGQTIHVPSAFMAGASDWGVYQFPGAFEKMQTQACSDMRFCELIPGAGHWVQQEQAQRVNRRLLDFLDQL